MAKSKKAAPDAAPADAPATPVGPPVFTEITRVLEFGPEDRPQFFGEKREVLKRPEPPPFDFKGCRNRLAKFNKSNYGDGILWDINAIASPPSQKEAHFWFLALTHTKEKPSPQELADSIKEKDVTGEIDLATVQGGGVGERARAEPADVVHGDHL